MTVKQTVKMGLAKYVREVSPYIDPATREKIPRGLFSCEHGHSFTAIIGSKEAKSCKHCHGTSSFSIADRVDTKTKLNTITTLTAAPSFKLSLFSMVAQQNFITEMAGVGEQIYKLPMKRLAPFASKLRDDYRGRNPKEAKTIDLITQVLYKAAELFEAGNTADAENVKKELVTILTKKQ